MKMHLESIQLVELLRTNMLSFMPERMFNESQIMIQESYQCTKCNRRFHTNGGLSQHLRSYQSKNANSTVSDTVTVTNESTLLDN